MLPLFCFVFATRAEAGEFHFRSYTLSEGTTVDDDLYVFGDSIKVNGEVNGDVILFAENVQVDGDIDGDVYAFGSKVDIAGNIDGNVFVFGGNVTVDGSISGNLYALCYSLAYLGDTDNDVFVLSYENTIKGDIGDDLRAFSLMSTVKSIVNGDLLLLANNYDTAEDMVSGGIYYNSTLESIAQEQGVDLDKNKIEVESLFDYVKQFVSDNSFIISCVTSIISFLSMLLAGCFLVWLTPVKTGRIIKRVTGSTSDFVKSLLVGLCVIVVVPVPLFILMISIVGFPIACIILGFVVFTFVFGKIWVELAFGREILKLFKKKDYYPYKSLLIGRFISVIIGLIPVVSIFYNVIVTLTSIGAIVRMKKDSYTIAKGLANKTK